MKIYNELESLELFEWLSKTHNLKDTDMTPEYLDKLPLNHIHKTVCHSMAFRWFREKHKMHNSIFWVEMEGFIYWNYRYSYLDGRQMESVNKSITFFNTPEEAELECLVKLIEIVKNK